jgi:hypothetical protein
MKKGNLLRKLGDLILLSERKEMLEKIDFFALDVRKVFLFLMKI